MDEKKKILIMVIVLGVLLVGTIVWMFISMRPTSTKTERKVRMELPDGEVHDIADRKSDAYRGKIPAEVLFENLAAEEQGRDISLVSSSSGADSGSGTDAVRSVGSDANGSSRGSGSNSNASSNGSPEVERVFGTAASGGSTNSSGAGRSGASGGGGRTQAASGGAYRPMTEAEKLEYDRKRAEMVRDVLAGSGDASGGETAGGQSEHGEESAPQSIDLSFVGSSDGIITTLDDEPSEGVEYGVRPFKCMFVRDQKISSGQRVTLRLLEDYVADGLRISANTHLAAICKIGERLELSVRSLEMNGRIIPLALDAYDTDGIMGIYCPETSAAKNSRKASNDAITTAGTTFGGLVGDITSTIIRTGASIARSATGEVSVNVVSGYEFYLVKSERK